MDEAKAMAQHQLMLHHQQQQQHHHQPQQLQQQQQHHYPQQSFQQQQQQALQQQHQLYVLQQLEKQKQRQQQLQSQSQSQTQTQSQSQSQSQSQPQSQLHQQLQQQAMARFPSNIDAHLRPPGLLHRPIGLHHQQQHQHQNPNPNSVSLPQQSQHHHQQPQNPNPSSSQQHQKHPQQQKPIRPGNQMELQMAYQDAWRVCHPDFKRPFSSLEDACERLLPYHVVADYEAEEDDRILDSDTTGTISSRSQQWDHNIAAKVAEFTATFEKQALAFNIISRKRTQGEFRSEERLMIEQALLQEERRAMLELRSEIEIRDKASREAHEAKLRMAAIAQAEQARAESQAHAEVLARAPIRASALGSQSNDISNSHGMAEQELGVNQEEMINGWGNNGPRDDKEPSEDFLNDEEPENGEAGVQDEWREVGDFDLNTR